MLGRVFSRFLAAAPDTATAVYFLVLWISPLHFGEHGVRNGILMMLVEFVLMHAAAFIGTVAFAEGVSRTSKLRTIAGFGLFYLLFIAAWAWSFREYWPLLAFGWLLVGKLAIAFERRRDSTLEHRARSNWAISGMTYLAGTFLSVLMPLPRWGLDAASVARLDLPGKGLWVDQPHTAIAFGLFYFGILAWTKWCGTLLPQRFLPGIRK